MTKRRPVIRPASCPLCGSQEVIRLPSEWQALVEEGARISIIGCGNPWHYAEFPVIPAPAMTRQGPSERTA